MLWTPLRDELRRHQSALSDRRLALTISIFAALLLLAAQFPITYWIDVGREVGPGSDLPLIEGFYPPERDVHGDFRWTTERAAVLLPGLGQRSLQVGIRTFPINEEVARRGPRELELWSGGRLLARLPVRPAGAIYTFVLPPPSDASGDHSFELRSATFVPTGDERAIGTLIGAVWAARTSGPTLPAWRNTLAWLVAALLAWLALRRIGFGPAGAQTLLASALLLASLAAVLDPPRFAFGGAPALTATALAWLLAITLTAEPQALLTGAVIFTALAGGGWLRNAQVDTITLPASVAMALFAAAALRPVSANIGRRLGVTIPPQAWRWLLLIVLVVFTTRYAGRLYPESMPGDIGFHANRYVDVVRGRVLLLSRNRGVAFPYPPTFYLLIAPISLLGLERQTILQLVGTLLDALSPLLVYATAAAIETRAGAAAPAPEATAPEASTPWTTLHLPLLAAGIYALSPAGFMMAWWSFSTHIFTQFAHLLLITALVLLWPMFSRRLSLAAPAYRPVQPTSGAAKPAHWPASNRPMRFAAGAANLTFQSDPHAVGILSGLIVLQTLVYLGHFGFWMNMSLLGGMGLAALLIAVLRRRASWRVFRLTLLGFAAAQAIAILLFYSNYTGVFLDQARMTMAGGLTGLAGRAPLDRAHLWRILWEDGMIDHFGFFPLPLALYGLFLLRQHSTPHVVRRVLIAGTFAIGLVFALLPFLSRSTLSTRWLMFSAWAIAIGAAAGALRLWRLGRAGRFVVIAAGAYTLWLTMLTWLTALAWRVRPPEPF